MKKIIIMLLFFIAPINKSWAQCSCQEKSQLICVSTEWLNAYKACASQGNSYLCWGGGFGNGGQGEGSIRSREVFLLTYQQLPPERQGEFLKMLPDETVKYINENKYKNGIGMPEIDLKTLDPTIGRLAIPSGLKKGERNHFEKVNKILDKKGIK